MHVMIAIVVLKENINGSDVFLTGGGRKMSSQMSIEVALKNRQKGLKNVRSPKALVELWRTATLLSQIKI